MTRRLALEVLRRVATGARARDALDQLAAGRGIDPRDMDLAREIVGGVLRARGAIDAIVASVASRDLGEMDDVVRCALRIGVYQIGWLDRVPRHAAVHSTVGVVREAGQTRASGFVNAILRKADTLIGAPQPGDGEDAPRRTIPRGDGSHLPLAAEVFADPRTDTAGHLAARWSHPRWLVERLLAQRGEAAARQVLAAGIVRPTLSLRPAPGRREELRAALSARGLDVGEEGPCLLVKGGGRVEELPGFAECWFAVQDATAAEVVASVDAPRGAHVLDLCAAPGGKTIALAEAVGAEGAVLAADLPGERSDRLRAEIARRGLGNTVALVECDVTDTKSLPAGVVGEREPGFTHVLLDAPCSNTGVLARRVEARWRLQGEADVAELRRLQDTLLEAASTRVRQGGRLVYATCSLDRDEDEGAVAAFCIRRRAFRLVAERLTLPVAGRRDGGYTAVLARR